MKRHLLSLSLISLTCASAWAQNTLVPASQAAQQAIESSPEVAARLNALRAAVDETDIARGGYLPRVDISAETGRTQDQLTNRRPQSESLSRSGTALTITQLLWDGGAISGEIGRLNHSRMARYFELIDTTEQIALEAVRAYQDVARFRRLVDLAEDNYVQHRYAFEQIQSRVKAGVGRGVDQDQAAARLALAESNLVTERANLHDVTERYRRIVGALPPSRIDQTSTLAATIPGTGAAALQRAAANSPSIAAAIENLRGARAQAEGRKSAYMPRVEARVRAGQGRNLDGVETQKRDVNAELALTWNLFNGGSDSARQRQSAHLINQAADLRDKACRDIRQTTAIAWNDTRKLNDQINFLERNVVAIERARDAYRQQFDISQRSLLDLLNSESELYTARRALANALFDRQVAEARTHAAMGTLVKTLGLRSASTADLAPDAGNWQAGDDGVTRCPLTPTEVAAMSREELDARVRVLRPATPAPTGTPSTAPASSPVTALPARVALAPAVTPASPQPTAQTAQSSPMDAEEAITQRVLGWVSAWSGRDVNAYLGHYAADFRPSKGSNAQWRAQRQQLVGQATPIQVDISDLQVKPLSASQVEARFTQRYRSATHSNVTPKTLLWEDRGGSWVIVRESNR
jgi:adhesin transport system outer membrane protein